MRLFARAADATVIAEAWDSRATWRALENTLTASAGSVVISVVLGTALALALGAFRMRGRVAMTFLALSPLLIPSQIMALAWIELAGMLIPGPNPIYSGTGIALLMGVEHMPLVFIAVRAALKAIPADLVEAARIGGASQGAILRRVILPLCLPACGAGAALAFAAAVGNFGVPALLGIPGRFPMLTTLIYQRLNGFGPSILGQVAVLALLLVALAGAALALRALTLRLAVPVPQGRAFDRPPAPRKVTTAVWAGLVLLMVTPMLALLGTALAPALGVKLSLDTASLSNFAQVAASPTIRRAFVNSLLLSVAAAVISTAVALPFAWLAQVARSRAMRHLDWLADAPFVVPGTVLALAVILTFLPPLPILGVSVYGTPAILLLAYLARFLPLALRPLSAAAASTDPALDEAARIFGAPVRARIARIFAPPVAAPALAGAVLIFMTAFNELTLSALLWSSGNETLGVMIFSLQYEGNSTGAAALSVLSLLLVAGLALVLDRACRGREGVLPWRD